MTTDHGKFTEGKWIGRVPIPHEDIPWEIRNRFRRPVFRLEEDLAYVMGQTEYRVYAGFLTDFASVPSAFCLVPQSALTGATQDAPAALHDALCRCCGLLAGIDRADADRLFYHGLRSVGFGHMRAYIWWLGVRMQAASSALRVRLGGERWDMTNPEGLITITHVANCTGGSI